MHIVYRLHFGKRTYATPVMGGASRTILIIVSSCLQHVHVVHYLCTVSTDHTRVNAYVHSVVSVVGRCFFGSSLSFMLLTFKVPTGCLLRCALPFCTSVQFMAQVCIF